MTKIPARLSLIAILALSACTGVSTGVRSPCFGPQTSSSSSSSTSVVETGSETGGTAYDCDFQPL
jgi:plastocyanin domain-containing protein